MSLDKQTVLEAGAAAKAAKNEPPPLNPDFPYVRVAFDPFFYGLDREPADPPPSAPALG